MLLSLYSTRHRLIETKFTLMRLLWSELHFHPQTLGCQDGGVPGHNWHFMVTLTIGAKWLGGWTTCFIINIVIYVHYSMSTFVVFKATYWVMIADPCHLFDCSGYLTIFFNFLIIIYITDLFSYELDSGVWIYYLMT